jgi:hypothetical protein
MDRITELEQRIEKLLETQGFDSLKKELHPELQRIHNQYVSTLDDALQVALIFFRGFDAISTDEITMDSKVNRLIKKWVKSINRDRSGRLIAIFLSIVYVATLEDFIQEIVRYSKELSDFNKDYSILESQEQEKMERSGGNKLPLEILLKPSAKKKHKWLKLIKQLFKTNLDEAIDEVMNDLIANRQEASHTDIQKQKKNISGEHLKLWYLGTRYLMQILIINTYQRIK